jgi:hypothetical protein
MPTDSYFVDFTAFIDERKRPEGFPKAIHIKDAYNNIESLEHLQYKVNERFVKLISGTGLVVLKDEDEIIDEGKITFDKRIYVPWHMITYMKLDVFHIPPSLSTVQDSIVPVSALPPEPTKDRVN